MICSITFFAGLPFKTRWNSALPAHSSGIRPEAIIVSTQPRGILPCSDPWPLRTTAYTQLAYHVWDWVTGPDPDDPSAPGWLCGTDLRRQRSLKRARVSSRLQGQQQLLPWIWRIWIKSERLTKGCRQVHGLRVAVWHLLCVDLVLPLHLDHFLLPRLFPCRRRDTAKFGSSCLKIWSLTPPSD